MDVPAKDAAAAGTWRLGDREVNRLGFGAMRLPGRLPWESNPPAGRDQSIAVLRRAVGLGVNHIDTAAFYFSPLRSANELINTALTPSIAEHFGALAELREAGLIRHLGVSEVTVAHLAEATAIAPVVCVQNRYSLDERQHDDVLRACTEQGIAFVPFFAIAGDRQADGGSGTQTRPLTEVARRHDATPAQVRLAWTLHQAPNVLAIPGTGDPAHLAENVAAAALRLSDEDLARLGW